MVNVAHWNGSAWSPLGLGLIGAPSLGTPCNALAFLGTDLYAGGNFTNAGGIATGRVAKWNGSAWSSLGGINGTVIRAISNSGSIYLCGSFQLASNTIGDHVIRFDGTSWHGVAGKPAEGTHLFGQALGWGPDGLYLGGSFSAVGTTPAAGIARWDGSNWNALGSGISGSYNNLSLSPHAIKATSDGVYIAGAFVNAGGVTVNNIGLWDGNNWNAMGYGTDGSVLGLDAIGSTLYVGGSYTNGFDFPGGGVVVNHIGSWDWVNGWLPLNGGVNGSVNAVCAANGPGVCGRRVSRRPMGNTANRVAVSGTGRSYSSLGTGAANGVSGTDQPRYLVDGTDVYVGGSFTTAGGATARAIAKWNGSSWSQLGQGLFGNTTPTVYSLAKSGSYLYVGGTFTNAGGGLVTRSIARWDGSNWQTLGTGIGNDQMSPRVIAMATSGNDVYAAGIFETAGVIDSGYIAHWNDQIDYTPPPVMRPTRRCWPATRSNFMRTRPGPRPT